MATITLKFIAAHAGAERAAAEITCKTGQSLMQAAVDANVAGIEADCGGLLTCATCHVLVQPPFAGQLPPPSEDELAMLEFTASPRAAASRLSCQIELAPALDGMTVDLPDTQH